MSRHNTTRDAAARMMRQELVRSIRNIARDSEWRIHFAFERAGCSCRPQRQQLERLEKERQERVDAAAEEIDRTLGSRIDELEREIAAIDELEHPHLDATGRRASQFFALWMMEQLTAGDTSFLDEDVETRATRFAESWLSGWRPSVAR